MITTTSNEHFSIRNRNLRNELLKKTDRYIVNDIFENLSDIQKQEIKQYRQTLRDFINIYKNKYLNDGKYDISFPDIPNWLNLQNPKY